MKFVVIIILSLIAIIGLVNAMIILEEDEIYKEGLDGKGQRKADRHD